MAGCSRAAAVTRGKIAKLNLINRMAKDLRKKAILPFDGMTDIYR